MSPHLKSTPALACQEYDAACRRMFIVNRLLFFCIYCFVQCQLRHCATRRKVAGSIPDCVIGNFHWRNPSGHTMALGLTPLTELSTRNISRGRGVKAAGSWGWQPYHLHELIVLKSGSLSLLECSGPVQGLLYLYNASCSVGLCAG